MLESFPAAASSVELFEDGFGELTSASLGSVLAGRTEYICLPETGPKGSRREKETMIELPPFISRRRKAAHHPGPV